jgi:hypothetical protein
VPLTQRLELLRQRLGDGGLRRFHPRAFRGVAQRQVVLLPLQRERVAQPAFAQMRRLFLDRLDETVHDRIEVGDRALGFRRGADRLLRRRGAHE